MAYISKIKIPGVEAAYLIKDSEGRLMIAPAYSTSAYYSDGDYYVKEGVDGTPGNLYVVRTTESGTTGIETTVSAELKSIKQSIAGAMHYIGITSTELTDGGDTKTLVPKTENSLTKTTGFVSGDVVLAPAPGKPEEYYEYVWNGTVWSEFGSTKAIGSMAYANSASGSTTITYNKSQYTGTVSVNEYSEGDSNYIKPSSVVGSVEVGTTTSASSVSKSVSKLVTTSVGVVSGTGAAVTNISTTQKGLGTTSIFGVEETAVEASKVEEGSTSVQVGLANKTSVVSGLGATAAADGSNPFVNATVDNDECLSWIEKPLTNTAIREAADQNITVQKVTIASVTGIAKKASTSTTVATGALIEGGTGDVIITSVTGATSVFAKKADSDVVVATGALSATGDGDDVNGSITISAVNGLVTGLSVTNENVLKKGTSSDTDAIKVLTGITSKAETKNLNLTRTDITDTVNVAITVNPDART